MEIRQKGIKRKREEVWKKEERGRKGVREGVWKEGRVERE